MKLAICMFWFGFDPPNLLLPWESLTRLTHSVDGPQKRTCQTALKSVERFKQTDRHTDDAAEKFVGKCRITCAARNDSA